LAEQQNYYPDLTFVHKDDDNIKFALDLKTTFRRNNKSIGFTLGSHGAYFKERDKKKNIQFPYNQYTGHYCLGIIYTRVDFEDDLSETEICWETRPRHESCRLYNIDNYEARAGAFFINVTRTRERFLVGRFRAPLKVIL